MISLPHFLVADSIRTVTIALWGLMLGQSFWALWYAARIRRLYTKLSRKTSTYQLMWWHILVITVVFDLMATEISWKIIFNGVSKVGIAFWTYPNLIIYLLANVALYLVVQVERRRYVKARVDLGYREIKRDHGKNKNS